jgi:ubiquinone/menaquinone biosynthesis C-methylase UbiE
MSASTTSPGHGVPERIDPLMEAEGIVAYHLKKYEFARNQIGGTVLDVACGVGYGTDFLSAACDRTIGVEIADEAIAIARSRYLNDLLWFVQGDAEQLPFPDACAEAVTCFEGIEHFADPARHLAEVARVLRPEGSYFVSTPHPGGHVHGDDNPFHLHEFELAEFEAILSAQFAEVSMFGQFRLQTDAHRNAQKLDVLGLRKVAWLRPLARKISRSAFKTAPTEEAKLEDFEIRPFDGEATEYVAVCSDPRNG